jgi:hypothetical protein
MKIALKTSPLGVSVSAWYEENGKYVDRGTRNNHWCVCYKIDEEGVHVFDSYDHSKKILSLDHNIGRAKRIWLNRKTKTSMRKQINILQIIVNLFMQKKTLLQVCQESVGVDVTPRDEVSDEVACAHVVTTLLKKIYPETPIITGTWTLYDYLRKPTSKFEQVTEPEPEDIIISPTGMGKPMTNGHVGVVMENDLIGSNDSRTGKFMQNYTITTWKNRYGGMGYPTLFFRRVV